MPWRRLSLGWCIIAVNQLNGMSFSILTDALCLIAHESLLRRLAPQEGPKLPRTNKMKASQDKISIDVLGLHCTPENFGHHLTFRSQELSKFTATTRTPQRFRHRSQFSRRSTKTKLHRHERRQSHRVSSSCRGNVPRSDSNINKTWRRTR